MQAIVTKYLCPTNAKGSRIQAKCEAMTIRVSYDDGLDLERNHEAVCVELCRLMDARNVAKYGSKAAMWAKPKATGQLPSGEFVHVFKAAPWA